MIERRRVMLAAGGGGGEPKTYKWVQLASVDRYTPIYAIGCAKFSNSDTSRRRLSFESLPGGDADTTADTTNPYGHHPRIYIGGTSAMDVCYYYFLNGVYSYSGFVKMANSGWVNQSIILSNGTVVNNVMVYVNSDPNKISSYDVEGQQRGAPIVYSAGYQTRAEYTKVYVLIEDTEA